MKTVRLGELVELKYGKALPKAKRSGEGVPVVGSSGIVGYHKIGIIEGPVVVIGRKGSIGSVTFVESSCWPIDTAYYVSPRSSAVYPKWLFHLLRYLPLEKMNKSAAIPGLNRDDVYNLSVPDQPLDEQRRIARTLDRVANLMDAARSMIQRFSLLRDIELGNAFRNAEYEEVTLGEVAEWGSGGTPRRGNPEYFGDGTPWLSISDLNDGIVYEAKESLTPAGIDHSSAKVVPPGTVFIAMYGSIGKLGVAGKEMCTSQAIAFARPHSDALDRDYLFYYLLYQRPVLIGLGRGGTQSNIGQKDLKNLSIPLPPLEEQRRLCGKFNYIDSKKNDAVETLNRISGLFSALQYRAFRGEL